MPLAQHLLRRGAVYYWRRRLPRRLAACGNRRHVLLLSLKTCSADRARRLAAHLDAAFEEIVIAMTSTSPLSADQIDAMLRGVIAAHAAKLDRIAAIEKFGPGFDAAEAACLEVLMGWVYRLLDAQGVNARVRDEDRRAMTDAGLDASAVAAVEHNLGELRRHGLVPTPRQRLEQLVTAQAAASSQMNLASAQQIYFRGLSLALFATDLRYAGRVTDAEDIVTAALRVDRTATPASVAVPPTQPALPTPGIATSAPAAAAAQPPVEDGIVAVGEKLIAKRAKDANWDVKGQRQARQIFDLMQRYMAEEQKVHGLASVRQHHLAAFIHFLEFEIYKHYGKSERDRTRAIAQLRKLASDKPKALQGLDGGTLNRHIGKLDQLFASARGRGIRIDPELSTIALRSRKTGNASGRARDERAKMLPAVMKAAFHAAPYLGCADWDRPYDQGSSVFHRALYWVPMLLNYTGARREEICGLGVDDVLTYGSIPVIHIGPNEFRRIKNPQSDRLIPLHPELLRLGFLEYVAAIRALGYRRLFPDLYSPTSQSPAGDRFYDEFMPVLAWACKTEGLDSKFVLHSIRHGFNSRLKDARATVEERADLMGHGGDSETSERYADPIELERALEVIKKLPDVTAHLQPQPIQLLPWVVNHETAPFSRSRANRKTDVQYGCANACSGRRHINGCGNLS